MIYLWHLFIKWTLEYPRSAAVVDGIFVSIVVVGIVLILTDEGRYK